MRMTIRAVGMLLSIVVVLGSGTAVAQPSKKSVDVYDTPGIHGFSVALVLGDMQGGSTADNLPPGAKKALADMRDFLPYKGYRLLDTQWILCCGSSKAGAGISGRLRGLGVPPGIQQVYRFAVHVLGAAGAQLSIRFVMDDGAGPSTKIVGTKVQDPDAVESPFARDKQEQKVLEMMIEDARKQHNAQHPVVKDLETQLDAIRTKGQTLSGVRGGSGKGAVIDSTFSMNLGETVVIGTSSLKGDQALIALLTAVRRPAQLSSTHDQP